MGRCRLWRCCCLGMMMKRTTLLVLMMSMFSAYPRVCAVYVFDLQARMGGGYWDDCRLLRRRCPDLSRRPCLNLWVEARVCFSLE